MELIFSVGFKLALSIRMGLEYNINKKQIKV